MTGRDAGEGGQSRSEYRNEESGPGEGSADDSSTAARGPTTGTSPRREPNAEDTGRIEDGLVRWFLETDDRTVSAIRVVATSLAIVATVSLLLYGISGQLPVLVAVESGSMTPNMQAGDLVFVVEEGRFAGDGAVSGTGVVTLEQGRETGYRKFGKPGDVIIFRPNGNPSATPVIHRAHFWVDADENWVRTKADSDFRNGASCTDIPSCPAPHDGFVTKGDANSAYDQLPNSGAETTVVSPEWVTGKAMVRTPGLGELRLAIDSLRSMVSTGSILLVASGAVAVLAYGVVARSDGDRS